MNTLINLVFVLSITFTGKQGGAAITPAYIQPGAIGQVEQISESEVRITTANGGIATIETNASQTVKVTLGKDMTFAADGNYVTYPTIRRMQTVKSSVMIASRPGTYTFQSKGSLNLVVGPITDQKDKTGYIVNYALHGRKLPIYWFLPEGPLEAIAAK